MAPTARRSSEYETDSISPLPIRAQLQLQIHTHLNLSSTTVSSVGSYRTNSTGGSRWSQDMMKTKNSGFGAGSPRNGNTRGGGEAREGHVRRRPRVNGVVVPPSMINALGLSTEDPNKEAAIAEIVMRHLDKQRRDAQDGEIKAAVDDLEGSVEHWSAQVEAWRQRRPKHVNVMIVAWMDKEWNNFELERCKIQERLRELKEDIKMLNSQNRAEELFGPTISKCATAIRDMEAALSESHQLRPRLAIGGVIEQVEPSSGDTTVQVKTEGGVELERGHLNDRQIENTSEDGKIASIQDDEVNQTETIELSHTPTTSNPSDGATYASNSTQTDLGDAAATPGTTHEEHAESTISERERQLLTLKEYGERLEQLRATAGNLAEIRERLKGFLNQANNKTFSSCTEPLRARMSRLRDDAAALLASFKLSEKEVPSADHMLQNEYTSMRYAVAKMYIVARSDLFAFGLWESCLMERRPFIPARRKNTADQMSWMKPMRPQRKPSDVNSKVDPPQPDAQTSLDATSIAKEETEPDVKDDSEEWELVSDASEHSYSDQFVEVEKGGQPPDPKALNALMSNGLRFYHEQEDLKQEVSVLESNMAQLPKAETVSMLEADMNALQNLLSHVVNMRKVIPKAPGMRRLSESLQNIIGEVSAMMRSLLFAEHEQKRRLKQKKDDTIKHIQENTDQSEATLQLCPEKLQPDGMRRDSGYFEAPSSLEEEYVSAVQDCDVFNRQCRTVMEAHYHALKEGGRDMTEEAVEMLMRGSCERSEQL